MKLEAQESACSLEHKVRYKIELIGDNIAGSGEVKGVSRAIGVSYCVYNTMLLVQTSAQCQHILSTHSINTFYQHNTW